MSPCMNLLLPLGLDRVIHQQLWYRRCPQEGDYLRVDLVLFSVLVLSFYLVLAFGPFLIFICVAFVDVFLKVGGLLLLFY